MDNRSLQQALEAFGDAPRVRFPYFQDRYALGLLRTLVADGTPLREVRRGAYARLIDRPTVKAHLAGRGDGSLCHNALLGLWPADYETFWLSAGQWCADYYDRGYSQISRPGSNLVLQLNFSARHDRPYRRLVRPVGDQHPFAFRGHPVASGAITLAWSRVDLDFRTGEALIEELQSDWLRFARRVARDWKGRRAAHGERPMLYGRVEARVGPAQLRRYVEHVLWRYERMWAEAMLWATLSVLHERMGVQTVYLHSPESGRVYKAPALAQPPRSLYTALPKKFCFERVRQPPRLLQTCVERFVARLVHQHSDLPFHRLQLQGAAA